MSTSPRHIHSGLQQRGWDIIPFRAAPHLHPRWRLDRHPLWAHALRGGEAAPGFSYWTDKIDVAEAAVPPEREFACYSETMKDPVRNDCRYRDMMEVAQLAAQRGKQCARQFKHVMHCFRVAAQDAIGYSTLSKIEHSLKAMVLASSSALKLPATKGKLQTSQKKRKK